MNNALPDARVVTPGHDPGDEHDRPVENWRFWRFRTGACYEGMGFALLRAYLANVHTEPYHDGGDEDDFHRYVPTVGRTGLRLWPPREYS